MMGGRSLPFKNGPLLEYAILNLLGFNEIKQGESLYSFYEKIIEQALSVSKTANERLVHQKATEVYKQLLNKHLDFLPAFTEDGEDT